MMRTTLCVAAATVLLVSPLAGCNRGEHSSDDGHAHGETKSAATAKGDKSPQSKKDEHDHGKEDKDNDAIKLSDAEIRAAGIKVEEAQEREHAGAIEATGTVKPNRTRLAHVTPRVAGRVVRVLASQGDTVRAGQGLAVLDSIELGEAHSAYAQATSEVELARANFERAEKLRADEIIPHKDFLQARAELTKAEITQRTARHKLQLLGVTPDPGRKDRPASAFTLTAPFAGTVIDKDAVQGELAGTDKTLFSIADLSLVWIEANVFERDLARVVPGGAATVTVAAFPDERFEGRVGYIGATLDKDTRTVMVRVDVPNKERRLRLEMFANVSIATQARVKTLSLPEEAVVLIQGQPSIFVEAEKGFVARPIAPGDKQRGHVAVKGGLQPGELVVTAGAYALKARLLKSQIGSGHAH